MVFGKAVPIGTWLRSLSFAEISTIMDDVEYIKNELNILEIPGFGWFF